MNKIMTAKSIDEAKAALLHNLNLDEFEIYDFEVLQEPTKGFLGIGSKDAEVRLLIKTDKLQKGQFLVKEMCRHLGYSVEFKASIDESKQELRFEFSGDDSSKMFKRLGRGAHKMEFLINCILNRKDRESYLKTVFSHQDLSSDETSRDRNARKRDNIRPKNAATSTQSDAKKHNAKKRPETDYEANQENDHEFSSSRTSRNQGSRDRNRNNRRDAGARKNNLNGDRNYRRNRSENKSSSAREAYLKNTAERMAQKVVETQQAVALNPMNSYDRRIIHSVLSETSNVTTRSEGEDDKRHVVIEYSAE